jgi:hypothetical protein
LLRHELVADGVADRLGQLVAMAGNHPLRPDSDAKKFDGLIRMEQHPDCQPRRAEPVNGGNYNDADRDQEFKSKRIDNRLTC